MISSAESGIPALDTSKSKPTLNELLDCGEIDLEEFVIRACDATHASLDAIDERQRLSGKTNAEIWDESVKFWFPD
jgi:hypothetical protein